MRYKSLDGLRGISAVIVLIHHCLIINPFFLKVHFHDINQDNNTLILKVFHFFWAGHEAVLLFFILSGFVLYNVVENIKDYKGYFFNRFIRIYVPYIIIILISTTLYIAFYNADLISNENKFSEWFNSMWPIPIDYLSIFSAIFMIGYNTHSINTVTWSLVHEFRISLFIPIIVWWLMKNQKKSDLFLIVLSLFIFNFLNVFVISLIFEGYFYAVMMNINDTIYYIIFFVIGIFLSIKKKEVIKKFRKINLKISYLLLISGIFFILSEWFLDGITKGKYSTNIFVNKITTFSVDMSISFGIIIVFCLAISCKPIMNFLECKIFIFLGKISYSLYLIHPIVILSLLHIFENKIDYVLLSTLSFFISIFSGIVFYLTVEKKSILYIKNKSNNQS